MESFEAVLSKWNNVNEIFMKTEVTKTGRRPVG